MSELKAGGGAPPPYCPKCCGNDCICPKPPAYSKPREWWIRPIDIGDDPDVRIQKPAQSYFSKNYIHVIDYEAYIKLERELDELREAFQLKRDAYNLLHGSCLQFQVERDDWANRYRLIELANAELSRNDHKTFGELLIERDRLNKLRAADCAYLDQLCAERNKYRAALERIAQGATYASELKVIAREALKSQDLPPFTVAGNPSESEIAGERKD